MKTHDDKLTLLLKQWRDIKPAASFEADVWRRIRLAQSEKKERVTVAEWLRRLLWRPAFPSVAASVTVALVVGSWSGVRSPSRTAPSHIGQLQFLTSDTLAGGYLRLAQGGGR